MLKLIDKQKIIIKYFNEGLSGRQIEKELHISRKTIRKYIKEYEEKRNKLIEIKEEDVVLIADICQKPKYDPSTRNKAKLTEEIIKRINSFLKENENKKIGGKSKQVKKKIDIYEALVSEGFDIGYTTVCYAISSIQRHQREAYIRQGYLPGQTVEFDWGEVKLTIIVKKTNYKKIYEKPSKGCRVICFDEFGLVEIRPYAGKCWVPAKKPTKTSSNLHQDLWSSAPTCRL